MNGTVQAAAAAQIQWKLTDTLIVADVKTRPCLQSEKKNKKTIYMNDSKAHKFIQKTKNSREVFLVDFNKSFSITVRVKEHRLHEKVNLLSQIWNIKEKNGPDFVFMNNSCKLGEF